VLESVDWTDILGKLQESYMIFVGGRQCAIYTKTKRML